MRTTEVNPQEWTAEYVEAQPWKTAQAIADAHNASLAAERERYRKLLDAERRRCFDLEQQLAAERESLGRAGEILIERDATTEQLRKQLDTEISQSRELWKKLDVAVEALENVKQWNLNKFEIHDLNKFINAALAKLKEKK